MDGCWKLLCRGRNPLERFDLEADPGEAANLLQQHPEQADRLAEQVRAFLGSPRDRSGLGQPPHS